MRFARFTVNCALILAPILTCACWSASAGASVVMLQAAHDNTLYQSETGDLSNGSGPSFFAGNNGGALPRRGLISFNVASAIPAGATINSVSLSLHVSHTSSGPNLFSLHRVLAAWGEGASTALKSGGGGGAGGGGAPAQPGDATWIHTFYPGIFWSSPGGDFSEADSASLRIADPGFYVFSSTLMADDVQHWLDHPAEDFGWLIHGDESTFQTTKRFDSRENPDAAVRPVLTIDYTSNPADLNHDGVVNTLDLGILLASWTIPPQTVACGGAQPCLADINHDGVVNTLDLGILLANWTL